MRFWDSSAIVPLLLDEDGSEPMRALIAQDPGMLVWSMTPVEVTSALWRRCRSGHLEERLLATAADGLADLEASWNVVVDLPAIVARARRLLGVHPLRVADAAQLAACLVACGEQTDSLAFVTLDERLAAAARREGLRILTDSR